MKGIDMETVETGMLTSITVDDDNNECKKIKDSAIIRISILAERVIESVTNVLQLDVESHDKLRDIVFRIAEQEVNIFTEEIGNQVKSEFIVLKGDFVDTPAIWSSPFSNDEQMIDGVKPVMSGNHRT